VAAPLQVVIEDDNGRRQAIPFDGDEITLGRAGDGNTVCLAERNVSRRHARFLKANGAVFLEDLGSANGTRVNGERLATRRRIRPGDLVQIGDYDIALQGTVERSRGTEKPTAEPPAATGQPAPLPPRGTAPPAPAALAAAPAPAPRTPAGQPRSAALGRALFLAAVAAVSLLAGWAAGTLTRSSPRQAAGEARAAPGLPR
jgi:pSer/pThr/pTyr-binding forkhead associated (FHA) protein